MANHSDEIRLIPLHGGWSIWSEMWLRGAGFPASMTVDLGISAEDRASFEAERLRISKRLREIAADPLFREALTWQNRGLLHGTLRSLLKRPPEAQDSKTREYERVVTSYVHRYCAKNDTIGFFGPVGWAQLSEEESALVLEPGPSLLRERNVYLEHWCVDALAEVLGSDSELRPYLAPRLHPAVRITGKLIERSDGSTVELARVYRRILQRCDGRTPARQLARELVTLELSWGHEEVFDAIQQLVDNRILIWTLDVPVDVRHPDEALRSELQKLPQSEVRDRSIAVVDELTAARRKIGESAGTDRLDGSIAELEQLFEQRTGAASTRRAGETYAGRTLVFEDCVRDVTCRLGRPFVERMRPLELVLHGARWYTYEIGRRYYARWREAFAELGAPEVDYRVFWKRIEPWFNRNDREVAEIVAAVRSELQSRWASALDLDRSTETKIARTYEELAPKIYDLFAAPHAGWPMARLHSPDLLISAASPEEVAAGNFELVLGEVHAAVSSIFSKVGVFQHPNPSALFARASRDLAGPSLIPIESKHHVNRAGHLPLRPQDYHLATGVTRGPAPRERTLLVSELVVFADGDRLRVRTRDRRLEWDLVEVLQQYLSFASISQFSLMGPCAHSPRVTIDRMVIARESWVFDPKELAFVQPGDLYERWVRARAWQREHGLPRFTFVRLSTETKPFLLDLENPISVDTLARRGLKSSVMSLSEMLPDFRSLWLVDADRRTYTAELRLVTVGPL